MLGQLLDVAAPVFGIALMGYLFAGIRAVDLRSITDLVLDVTAPALVFASLAERAIEPGEMLGVGGGAIFQSLACGALAWAVFSLARIRARGLLLATMFPNTGNLGLPLALFAFGDEGLAAAVIVFVSITLVHYTVGIAIVSGSMRPGVILRTPLVYAAVLGLLLAFSGVTLPSPLLRGMRLLGDAAVPLMLLSLGVRMRSVAWAVPG
ncbi:MAG: AEC family transporter, partial [Acidobacteria bacterium]|nr:AEC family transporter [Acidobacteriota bacterium]